MPDAVDVGFPDNRRPGEESLHTFSEMTGDAS